MKIIRRTFEAAKHPQGSPERDRLNGDVATSEYMTSRRYAVVDEGFSASFRTKAEAEDFVARTAVTA